VAHLLHVLAAVWFAIALALGAAVVGGMVVAWVL
jgi:hypothetical protein